VPFTVSKATQWEISGHYIKVPVSLVRCKLLTPNAKLLLMMLINQVGWEKTYHATLDLSLDIHRSTRIRCIAELRELGFVSGEDSHYILNDPLPILAKLARQQIRLNTEANRILNMDAVNKRLDQQEKRAEAAVKRDFLQEATDAWNLYRPKNYQKIRRISASVSKALDIHMKELSVDAHNYEEFFSIIKSGVEKSDFWLNQNTNKTLESITGVGNPTDKKRSNVYSLFNAGISDPARPTEEKERVDTIVYPASLRSVISDYESAQHAYNEAYRQGNVDSMVEEYVMRTEQAIKDAGLDPTKFRFKYGMKTWPTGTPEPKESRVIDWVFDDERGYAY
jgi:hypothetical protein